MTDYRPVLFDLGDEAEALYDRRRREVEEGARRELVVDRELEEVSLRNKAKLHEAGTPVSAYYRLAGILIPGFVIASGAPLPHLHTCRAPRPRTPYPDRVRSPRRDRDRLGAQGPS